LTPTCILTVQARSKKNYRSLFPESVTKHSHRERIVDIFKRYFDSGASLNTADLSFDQSEFLREALSYQFREWRYLVRSGSLHWFPYAVVYDAAKFVGLQLGRREESLPRWMTLRISDTLSRKYRVDS